MAYLCTIVEVQFFFFRSSPLFYRVENVCWSNQSNFLRGGGGLFLEMDECLTAVTSKQRCADKKKKEKNADLTRKKREKWHL